MLRIRLDYTWNAMNMLGVCRESAWNMYGIRIGHAWNMHEHAWNMRGICLEYV